VNAHVAAHEVRDDHRVGARETGSRREVRRRHEQECRHRRRGTIPHARLEVKDEIPRPIACRQEEIFA
jgi:hypothetical protein